MQKNNSLERAASAAETAFAKHHRTRHLQLNRPPSRRRPFSKVRDSAIALVVEMSRQ
ncbi:hypothetical protein ACVI7B_009094, partial [Bradyrhizobium elkanii]